MNDPNAKLTIELVPKTQWFTNVRSQVSKEDWDYLRRESYKSAGYRCEICGGVGDSHPVECHEIWNYDDNDLIQKLEGLISLCPSCHEVKHIGLTQLRGKYEQARKHMSFVNRWGDERCEYYVDLCFIEWKFRSRFEWDLDLTWLTDKGIKFKNEGD